MPGIDLSRPLLAVGASAKTDWASASADTGLTFTGKAQLRRGLNVEIGLEALATADANFRKFIAATARGNAFAAAEASLQIQLPLNLFDEFGVVVGAQAVAQAAAGIEVGLGISVGDFVRLAQQDPASNGLPLSLLLMLLEEVDISAVVEVHVAASAMAYAVLKVSGNVIGKPTRAAGFYCSAKAGCGCAAGVGFSARAGAGFKDFRRFYGRAIDKTLDTTLQAIEGMLPPSADFVRPLLTAFGPVAKTAFRTAYEIGDYIARNSPGNSPKEASDLANHCVGIVLEEAQRFLFGQLLGAGLKGIQGQVAQIIGNLVKGGWDALMPERRALADLLYRMPAEPFQPTEDNTKYWGDLLTNGVDFVTAIPGLVGDDMIKSLAMLYAGAELLIEAITNRVNQAQAYAVAIGAGRVATKPSFTGPVANAPPRAVKTYMCRVLGKSASASLDYADLIQFLVDDVVVDALRREVPEVDAFLQVFKGPVAAVENDVLRMLLTHGQAFVSSRGNVGEADPDATLQMLLGALDTFITQQVQPILVTEVNKHIDDGNVRLYFNEVLLPSILFTKDVAFRTALNWSRHPINKDEFTEALASVMTGLLGRTLVLFADSFFAAVQQDMQKSCDHAASRLTGRNDPFKAMGLPADPVMRSLFATVLRGGGALFGPLPSAQRARIRSILYEVVAALPVRDQQSFVAQLGDDFFIPNIDHMNELSTALLDVSRERFERFIELMFEAGGALAVDALEAFIVNAADLIKQWERRLAKSLHDLDVQLARLVADVRRLAAEVEAEFQRVQQEIQALFQSLGSASLRRTLRQAISETVSASAKADLRRNSLYRNLPLSELKQAAENLLADTIHGVIEGPLVDPFFNALGVVADSLDDLLTDIRALDPRRPLAAQVLDLVLDRVEEEMAAAFGSGEPHVDLAVTLQFDFFGPQHTTFNLGRIDLPRTRLFQLMRSAVAALDFYEAQLATTAQALADAFATQVELQGQEVTQAARSADQARLSRLQAEHSAAPKTIAIVDPRPQAMYDRDVEAWIHLGDVPMSYLGMGRDEQQRVFVFLNGVLVPPQSLLLGEASGQVDSRAHLANITVNASMPRGAPRTLGSVGGAIVTRAAKTAHAVNSIQPAPALRAGRVANPSGLARIDRTLGGGTDLRIPLPLSALAAGTNTLTVIVLDAGGKQYRQTVTFGAASPPRLRPAAGKLPKLPTPAVVGATRVGSRPIAVQISLQHDQAALASAAHQAQTFVRKQARLNLPALPKRSR